MKILTRFFCLANFVFCLPSVAQFAPAAGMPGSTAIKADSSCFISWATQCTIKRGLKQINLADSGYANTGISDFSIGEATRKGVVSLGDGGIAILGFDSPIFDGEGFDFAVFENAFSDSFLELAFVEVSSDSIHWVRFPSESLSPTKKQTPTFGFTQATKIHNLAGKYRHPFGTPFDLADLPKVDAINTDTIRFIKIVDVVGCIDSLWGSRDRYGRIVNDPWPTNFGSSGFDLDAIGVIHQLATLGQEKITEKPRPPYFNTATQILVSSNSNRQKLSVYSSKGKLVLERYIPSGIQSTTINLPVGIYIAKVGTSTIRTLLTSNF